MEKLTIETIDKIIDEFTTKHKEGFTRDEIDELLSTYDIDSYEFYKATFGNTYMIIGGVGVYYRGDVKKSLYRVLKNIK